MFELVFLGTSASAPSVQRGLSANLLMHDEHRFLIDCGEGTQRQLLKSGLGFKRLDKVLITHGHLDHILGLGGLISTMTRWETIEKMEIYAGLSALERIHDLIERVVLRGARPPMELELRQIETGVLFEEEDFCLRAFPVSHRGPDCFGFVFQEKNRRPFLNDKAEALGIPQGPIRKQLVLGRAVTLEDGRTIQPGEVLGPDIPGAKLVYVGDVAEVDSLVETARDADLLVIEATYLHEDIELAQRFGHITAMQGAKLALAAGVGRLGLTHLSRRYHDTSVLTEAKAIFPHTFVANDFDSVKVVKAKSIIQEYKGPA